MNKDRQDTISFSLFPSFWQPSLHIKGVEVNRLEDSPISDKAMKESQTACISQSSCITLIITIL